jgi:hypothetical protein
MREPSVDRREYIATLTAAIVGSIAGCNSGDGDGGRGTTTVTTESTTTYEMDPLAVGSTTTTALKTVENHPSLLVTEDDYGALRERASEEPWASWKERALSRAKAPMTADEWWERNRVVQDRASGAALAYVLDPDDRETYAEKAVEAIDHYHEHIYPKLGDGWRQVVLPSGPFFTSVLALDVVQGDLSGERIADAEAKLQDVADWYWNNRDGAWDAARYGAYGVWAVYKADVERLETATRSLLEAFRADWPTGVYGAGCEYASARFAGFWGRNTKVHLLDVLSHAAGVDVYGEANRSVSRDHEWLFGHSLTPIVYAEGGATGASAPQRDCYTFGDAGPHHVRTSFSSAAYRAGKFGGDVANNAAWALVGENPRAAKNAPGEVGGEGYAPSNRNLFCAYVLTESVPAEPDPIPSRIYDEGGAWFHGDSHDTETLAGALWNHTRPGGHAHPDTNAIHCCAYGEHVLRNAGYNGWGNGVEGFGWEYIHDRAVANNVALVDYAFGDPTSPPAGGHTTKRGAGIAEGFVDDPGPVAYASGDDGAAVAGGTHTRNLVFVPPSDGVEGYWLLLDEVATDGETIHTALHPNAGQAPTADDDGLSYTVPVGGPHPRSENDVRLTVAYGTEPADVTVKRGALADWEESFVGRYLYASYPAAADGLAGIVTALFPHDGDHSRAEFERLPGSGPSRSGIVVRQGEVIDRAVETAGEANIGPVTVQGRAALVRERGGEAVFALLHRGIRFEAGDVIVRSQIPMSLALRGTRGNVSVERDTSLHVEHPELRAVELNGERAAAADSGGVAEVGVPAGSHALELVTGG